nr:unnamed protein product [Spirometra erinaceieuropaei]
MLRQPQPRWSGHPVGIDECLSERISFQHIQSTLRARISPVENSTCSLHKRSPSSFAHESPRHRHSTTASVDHSPDASTDIAELAIIILA